MPTDAREWIGILVVLGLCGAGYAIYRWRWLLWFVFGGITVCGLTSGLSSGGQSDHEAVGAFGAYAAGVGAIVFTLVGVGGLIVLAAIRGRRRAAPPGRLGA